MFTFKYRDLFSFRCGLVEIVLINLSFAKRSCFVNDRRNGFSTVSIVKTEIIRKTRQRRHTTDDNANEHHVGFCYYHINAYTRKLFITKPVLVVVDRPQASCANLIQVSFGVFSWTQSKLPHTALDRLKTKLHVPLSTDIPLFLALFFFLNLFLTFSAKFGAETHYLAVMLMVETPNSNKKQKQKKTLVASNNIARPPAFTGSRQAPRDLSLCALKLSRTDV